MELFVRHCRYIAATVIGLALMSQNYCALSDDRRPTRFGRSEETSLFVAVSPDGKSLLYATALLQIGSTDLPTGKNLRESELKGTTAGSVAFAQTGEYWVTAQGDEANVRDGKTGKILRSITSKGGYIGSVSLSTTGQHLVLVSAKCIELYSFPDAKLIRSLASTASHAVVTSDGKTILAANSEGIVSKYDVKDGTRSGRGKVELRDIKSLSGMTLAASDDIAFIGTDDGTVWSVDVKTATATELIDTKASVTSVAVSPDGKLVAVGTFGSSLLVVDAKTKKTVVEKEKLSAPPASFAFTPDNHLAFGLWDGSFGLLAIDGGKVKWTLAIKQDK